MKIQWECSGSAGKSATRDVPQQPSTHSSSQQQPGMLGIQRAFRTGHA